MNGMRDASATARAMRAANGSTVFHAKSHKGTKSHREWWKFLSDRIVTVALLAGLMWCYMGDSSGPSGIPQPVRLPWSCTRCSPGIRCGTMPRASLQRATT